jgi:hypothetical protein
MAWNIQLYNLPDIRSVLGEGDGTIAFAEVTASGETASIRLHAGVDDQGAETVVETEVMDDTGTKLTTGGAAAASGDSVVTVVKVDARVDDEGAEGSTTAKAEAESEEGGTPAAAASTGAEVIGPGLEVVSDRDETTTETGPGFVSETSVSSVEAERYEVGESELPDASTWLSLESWIDAIDLFW